MSDMRKASAFPLFALAKPRLATGVSCTVIRERKHAPKTQAANMDKYLTVVVMLTDRCAPWAYSTVSVQLQRKLSESFGWQCALIRP